MILFPSRSRVLHWWREKIAKQEMDNSKRVSERLGVVKKKPLKRAKKQLLRKVVDYLKSDTFMYAPLVSPLPSDFRPPTTLPSSAKVVELKKSIKEKKRVVEQVEEYLKSDVYMYAPMVVPPPHSPKESLQQYKMISVALSTERLTMTSNLPTGHLENGNQRAESQLPQTGLTDQHILGYRETVKHTVYQSCRSTSASVGGTNSLLANAKVLWNPARNMSG